MTKRGPPRKAPDFIAALAQGVACVNCGSEDVGVVSLYGAHPSEMLMRCNSCRTHFGWFKFRAPAIRQEFLG